MCGYSSITRTIAREPIDPQVFTSRSHNANFTESRNPRSAEVIKTNVKRSQQTGQWMEKA
jgi:hypothetical protein